MTDDLSGRQQRELDYHRERAREHDHILSEPFSWDVIREPGRRWWNAYWQMYDYLTRCELRGREVLVIGCGFGEDALRIAALGARVSAFDLSPESLSIARGLAAREGLEVDFREMPAERMHYEDNRFAFIVARDILHHVDIDRTMREIVRVAQPGATLVLNEIYSHSTTDMIRRSRFVERFLYPRMLRFIYGPGKPYITQDERKLTESDLRQVRAHLAQPHLIKYFNFLVNRVLPDNSELLAKADRIILTLLSPMGALFAGRLLLCARIGK